MLRAFVSLPHEDKIAALHNEAGFYLTALLDVKKIIQRMKKKGKLQRAVTFTSDGTPFTAPQITGRGYWVEIKPVSSKVKEKGWLYLTRVKSPHPKWTGFLTYRTPYGLVHLCQDKFYPVLGCHSCRRLAVRFSRTRPQSSL